MPGVFHIPDPYTGLSKILRAMKGLPLPTQIAALIVACVLGTVTMICITVISTHK